MNPKLLVIFSGKNKNNYIGLAISKEPKRQITELLKI